MSTNKYADLPDIDTAPDVYETEDAFPSPQAGAGEALEDDVFRTTRVRQETSGKEELDTSSLISPEDAGRKFRKAEKKRDRTRLLYAYPDSLEDLTSPLDATGDPKPLPLSQRLRALQTELASLENELADPSNPAIQKEREVSNVDPGELIRGLVDVRSRLDKIVREKEGRARLVENILHESSDGKVHGKADASGHPDDDESKHEPLKSGVQNLVDVDRRVEELERLVGSASLSLDDSSSLPPPLLPLITKLNSQLALLTQPRHLDSISRRLKLLLSDLERAAAAQSHKRQSTTGDTKAPAASNHEQLLIIVNRIAPSLPQIPHILSRLRTLSTLHAAAGEFQETLKDLEQEQKKIHNGLQELQGAVETIEKSLEENRTVVKENVSGLDSRVNELLRRLEDIRRERT